jgi:outer membrane receptor protein involved in Fe transport
VVADTTVPSTHSPSSTMLDAERLERMPLAQRTSLPDAIVTAAPGMIRGHDDFVHIRGHEVALNPSVGGVQFWENAHAVFSPGIGVDYIDSINVMTGGFPAEYGNRFGGVLDVVTKSGSTMQNRGSVIVGMGTAGRHNAGADFGGQRGRAGYYVNLAGFASDRFLSPPSPRSIHNTGYGMRSFGRFDFRTSTRSQLNVLLTGDGINFELPMDERDEQLRPDFRNLQRTRSQSAIVSWSRTPSSETTMQTAFYQRWSNVRQFPDTIDRYGAQTDADRTLSTFGVKGDVTRVAGRHAVKGGVDIVLLRPDEEFSYLSQPWIDFTHLPEVNEPHVHFRGPNAGAGVPRPVIFADKETGGQISVYAQDKLQFASGLTIDAGLRFDRYTLAVSESHVSPRVNTAFQLSSGTVLFASYNHFVVPPPIENVLAGSAGLTSLVSEIGRPLPPVRAITEDQFEAGVTHPVRRVGTVGVTGYYRVSDNPAHTSLFPDSRFYTYANFDRGKAYGVEMRADVPRLPFGLSGYVNYAVGRVWFYNPITAGFTIEAAHLSEANRFLAPMDQTHTATAGVSYQHDRSGLWSSVTVEYGSGTPGAHGAGDHEHDDGAAHEHGSGAGLCAIRCDPHFTQGAAFGWNSSSRSGGARLSLQVTVENVSNRVYLLSRESTMVQGQYSIPRLISGSLRVRF